MLLGCCCLSPTVSSQQLGSGALWVDGNGVSQRAAWLLAMRCWQELHGWLHGLTMCTVLRLALGCSTVDCLHGCMQL